LLNQLATTLSALIFKHAKRYTANPVQMNGVTTIYRHTSVVKGKIAEPWYTQRHVRRAAFMS